MNLYLSTSNLQRQLFFLVTTDLNFDSVAHKKKTPLNISNIIAYSLQEELGLFILELIPVTTENTWKNVSCTIEATAALIFINCFHVVYYNHLLRFWPSYLLYSLAAVFSVTPELLSFIILLAWMSISLEKNLSRQKFNLSEKTDFSGCWAK